MRKQFQTFWENLLKIGYSEDLSYIDKVRLKILNQQGFYVVLIVLSFILKTILEGEEDVWLLFIILFLSFGMLFFNYLKKYMVARLYWVVFFPTLMMGVVIMYGPAINAQMTFFIFMITTLIFLDSKMQRFLIVLFTFGLFAISLYYTENYESPFAEITDVVDKVLIFVVTTLCLTAIINSFSAEINKHIKYLEASNKELSKANEEIERFAYISSHNLKTPVRTIRSFSGLIERDLKKKKHDNLFEYLDYIKIGSEQMQFLITDILEYSKINQFSKIQLEEVNPNQLLKNLKLQVQSNTDKELIIIKDDLPTILSNKTFVNAIFQNLLENSVKYNDNDEVIIEIKAEKNDDTHLFSFKDNGIGIEEMYHKKIFGMFERLHNDAEKQGTGIGLAMSKKMIEKLHGKIWLESQLGHGTTFYLSFPKNEVAL